MNKDTESLFTWLVAAILVLVAFCIYLQVDVVDIRRRMDETFIAHYHWIDHKTGRQTVIW